MKAEVTGIDEANKALSSELKRVGDLSERFVTKAAISIEANTTPYVPVDTSTLLNSSYRKVAKKGAGYEGEMGYGVDYAGYVHDAPGTLKGTNTPRDPNKPGRGDFWDPTGEPEFLTKGVQDFIENDLDKILRDEMGR